jgi:dGTPase
VRHSADLVVPGATLLEVHVLKGIAAHYVMQAQDRLELMARERELLAELFTHLVAHPEQLDATFRADHAAAADDAARTRVVLDQIASLTDASAVGWHRALLGSGA